MASQRVLTVDPQPFRSQALSTPFSMRCMFSSGQAKGNSDRLQLHSKKAGVAAETQNWSFLRMNPILNHPFWRIETYSGHLWTIVPQRSHDPFDAPSPIVRMADLLGEFGQLVVDNLRHLPHLSILAPVSAEPWSHGILGPNIGEAKRALVFITVYNFPI